MATEQAQKRITRDIMIADIFRLFPHKSQRLAQEITNAGLHCVGCGAANMESLEAGMLGHGFTQDKIDALIARLNAILDEEADPSTITLTEKAAKKYLQVLEAEEKQGWGLRFMEKSSGCKGFEYILDYSEAPSAEDHVYTSHGIEIHVRGESLDRLLGSVIDYVDGLQGAGFKVTNPNVTASCGCGSSHNYK